MAKYSNEIRVRAISDQRYATVKNIAAYYGETMGAFVKRELVKIIELYPDHIKNYKPLQDQNSKTT